MRIQEYDPNKRYVVSLPNDNLTAEDVESIKASFKAQGFDAIVVAGAELANDLRYWGLYCPQHNIWLQKTDGMFIQFDAAAIAQAWLDTLLPRSPGLGVRHFMGSDGIRSRETC